MPQKGRKKIQRWVTKPKSSFDADLIEKRRKRYLDDLERSNATEQNTGFTAEGTGTAKDRAAARATISTSKKKSTMKVRTALLYKKTFTSILEESGLSNNQTSAPNYLTAVSKPSIEPARLICSSCGYWGRYKCMRCLMPYCDMNCRQIHDETRCERRVS